MKKIDPIETGKFILLGAGVFVLYKTFKGLGLIKSQQEEANDQKIEQINTGNFKPLSPKFWEDMRQKYPKNRIIILTQAQVKNYVQNLKDADLIVASNKDKIFGVFNKLKTQTQVSYLADGFYKITNKDLDSYLNIGYGRLLNDSDKIKLYNIINNLPIGVLDTKTNKIIL